MQTQHLRPELGNRGREKRVTVQMAVRFWMLPQVPVKLILWCGDDELPASLSVLFDASIEQMLAADGIWAMVRLLVERMLATD